MCCVNYDRKFNTGCNVMIATRIESFWVRNQQGFVCGSKLSTGLNKVNFLASTLKQRISIITVDRRGAQCLAATHKQPLGCGLANAAWREYY